MHSDELPGDAASDTRHALVLIGAFLALRTVAAWFCPATIDEACALVVSRAWSLSYYDHPPAGFTLGRIAAWLAGSEDVFLARIPFLVAGAATAWLVYDVTRLAYGSTAGLWALAWHSVAPFFLVSAGHFVVPDGPLDLALLLTLRLVLPDLLAPDRPPSLGRWCLAGAACALAFTAKYQAVLFGASALAFLLTSPPHRRLLAAPATWLALAIATVGLVPTVVWNAAHGWQSVRFQAGRAGTGALALEPKNFLLTLAGQLIYVLPGTWLVTIAESLRGIVRPRAIADRLFGWFAIVPPVVFLAIALVSRKSLPHWAMSGFLFGFPLVGAWTVRTLARHRRLMERTWAFTAAAVAAAFLGYAWHARYAVLTRPFAAVAPAWDLDWQHLDWPVLPAAWPEFGSPKTVVVTNCTVASKAGHALGPEVAVVALSEQRHFQFVYPPPEPGCDAVAIEPRKPGTADASVREFPPLLEAHGWQVTGPPRVLDQTIGGQLRFHLVAVPVRRR